MKTAVAKLEPEQLAGVKRAYTTRRVDFSRARTLINGRPDIRPGQILLARVKSLGQHQRIELIDGRRARMFRGDTVAVAYGNRYAPDQFEALVPEDMGPCDLVAGGGVAARMLSRHKKVKNPTVLEPLGLLGDDGGHPLNLSDFSLAPAGTTKRQPMVLSVLGTAMNAGKTTTAAYLVKGLVNAGLRVGAAKVTGTGAGGDEWFMKDAGADPVLSFIDAGLPSTYGLSPDEVEALIRLIVDHLTDAGTDVVVLEVSDGLYQAETANLVCSTAFGTTPCNPCLREYVDGVIFAAHDAMGARAGVDVLRQSRIPVLGLSGMLTISPLAVREAAQSTGLTVFTAKTLIDGSIYGIILDLLDNIHRQSSAQLKVM